MGRRVHRKRARPVRARSSQMPGNLPRGRDSLGAPPTTPAAAAEATAAIATRWAAERAVALRAWRVGTLGLRAGAVSLLTLWAIALGTVALRTVALGTIAIVAARPLMLALCGRTIAA